MSYRFRHCIDPGHFNAPLSASETYGESSTQYGVQHIWCSQPATTAEGRQARPGSQFRGSVHGVKNAPPSPDKSGAHSNSASRLSTHAIIGPHSASGSVGQHSDRQMPMDKDANFMQDEPGEQMGSGSEPEQKLMHSVASPAYELYQHRVPLSQVSRP